MKKMIGLVLVAAFLFSAAISAMGSAGAEEFHTFRGIPRGITEEELYEAVYQACGFRVFSTDGEIFTPVPVAGQMITLLGREAAFCAVMDIDEETLQAIKLGFSDEYEWPVGARQEEAVRHIPSLAHCAAILNALAEKYHQPTYAYVICEPLSDAEDDAYFVIDGPITNDVLHTVQSLTEEYGVVSLLVCIDNIEFRYDIELSSAGGLWVDYELSYFYEEDMTFDSLPEDLLTAPKLQTEESPIDYTVVNKIDLVL